THARLFDTKGRLVADSNLLRGPGAVAVAELPEPEQKSWLSRSADWIYDGVAGLLPSRHKYPVYREADTAGDYGEATQALPGRIEIPDVTGRSDEIGELAASLREMTDALWQRMSAIESFAADVAHEIKNPLSSLRSAVETVARIDDPDKRGRLMAIIQDDVER